MKLISGDRRWEVVDRSSSIMKNRFGVKNVSTPTPYILSPKIKEIL